MVSEHGSNTWTGWAECVLLCMHVNVYVVVIHAFSWLWLLCMRSLYAASGIMHDFDILI